MFVIRENVLPPTRVLYTYVARLLGKKLPQCLCILSGMRPPSWFKAVDPVTILMMVFKTFFSFKNIQLTIKVK